MYEARSKTLAEARSKSRSSEYAEAGSADHLKHHQSELDNLHGKIKSLQNLHRKMSAEKKPNWGHTGNVTHAIVHIDELLKKHKG